MTERNIIVLTGAGIGREAGLPTFRDPDGLRSATRLLDLARPVAFFHDPVAVHGFYKARPAEASNPEVQPNPAHLALARLEQMCSGDVGVVTRNVDDRHQRAESSKVLHMHGRLNPVLCNARDAWTGDVSIDTPCPACAAAGPRPDNVWFGEMPFHMEEIDAVLGRCDLFVSICISGSVYPDADFVRSVPNRPNTVELNLETSAGASLFVGRHLGPASQIVPTFVDELLARQG
jgi:NAD-dependent deacetylase